MSQITISEGDRFALLDPSGSAISEWRVVSWYVRRNGLTRVVLFNVDEPDAVIELYASDLGDHTRFRAVSEERRNGTQVTIARA